MCFEFQHNIRLYRGNWRRQTLAELGKADQIYTYLQSTERKKKRAEAVSSWQANGPYDVCARVTVTRS